MILIGCHGGEIFLDFGAKAIYFSRREKALPFSSLRKVISVKLKDCWTYTWVLLKLSMSLKFLLLAAVF